MVSGGLKADIMSGEEEFNLSCWTTTIPTEVMVQVQRSRIENLPSDPLTDILVRVAKSPNGAAEIAGIFTVSKSFQQFSEDGVVLRAISFTGLSITSWIRHPLVGQYEEFLKVGGLVARSAIAGNPAAQCLLAKVIMISVSTISNDDIKTSIPSPGKRFFLNLTRTSRFMKHFSDRTMWYDMIKVFISEAKMEEVEDMKHYLEDFVAYVLGSGQETNSDQFLTSLAKFCSVPSDKLLLRLSSIAYFVHKFNHLCTNGLSMLRKLRASEKQQQCLQRCLVQKDEPIEFEGLIGRVDTLMPIIGFGYGMASTRFGYEAGVMMTKLLFLATMLRKELQQEICTEKDRTVLISKYEALFY